MNKYLKGIERAQHMRRWANRKGGLVSTPNEFDHTAVGTLAYLVESWLMHLKELAYSPRSVKTYKSTMRSFLQWAHDQHVRHPARITKPILEDYQRWLFLRLTRHNHSLNVTTQRGRLGTVRLFFAWLHKTKQLPTNPAADLELPRRPQQSLPRALALEEIRTVLNIPIISNPLGLRDRAILEIFYATGIRRSELVNLDTNDLDTTHGVLIIRKGKGGKDRVVPVGAQAMHWVGRYLVETRPLLESNLHDNALFLTGYGERFSAGALGNWMHQVLIKAHIDRAGSCHLFRHSCATHMLENGADIRFIQELLGHSRLDTTQIYTDVSILQLKAVHARTHPSATGQCVAAVTPTQAITRKQRITDARHEQPISNRPIRNMATESAFL